ncbi:hypothetical protein CLOSTHATH_02601 [Hungatella hathewayi DSM 13479]|uniref:Uncharacterized protein n=1 Tax=Hungatella hathewayi DSM 13479 TaxID=566550 RepID=D3AG65_9FIRM|nr:hypothetical protein CLOSTHATH_02601 [Hungatella hathewayi DSM 13479]
MTLWETGAILLLRLMGFRQLYHVSLPGVILYTMQEKDNGFI